MRQAGEVGLVSSGPTPAGSAGFSQTRLQEDQSIKVTLQDCLACSGCVTSAETVLLEHQSIAEFTAKLRVRRQQLSKWLRCLRCTVAGIRLTFMWSRSRHRDVRFKALTFYSRIAHPILIHMLSACHFQAGVCTHARWVTMWLSSSTCIAAGCILHPWVLECLIITFWGVKRCMIYILCHGTSRSAKCELAVKNT